MTQKKELKSRQATIAITPSIYEEARNYALQNRQSFNDLVQMLLEQYIQSNRKQKQNC